jgi:PIN domain nuclease of toxin-antitoxin system
MKQAAFTPDIAIGSSCLPGEVRGDPADRLIIATARHFGLPIMTRDRKIIAYAASGEVSVVVC